MTSRSQRGLIRPEAVRAPSGAAAVWYRSWYHLVIASLDLEFGLRDFAPEPVPEFDHPWKRDDVWVWIRCDVQFVPFCVIMRVIVPTNRSIGKRAGLVRLRRTIVELVGPARRVRVTVCSHTEYTDDGPIRVFSPLTHAIDVVVGQ